MLTLRGFQLDCVNRLDSLESACLVAPTGAGKTVIGAALSWREVSRGGQVGFVIPRDNLARQTRSRLRSWDLTCGYVLGSEAENRAAKVQIVSYQSLGSKKRSLDWLADKTTLWIVDEAHITAFSQALRPYLAQATQQGKRKIGLTATPWQLSKRSLLDVFKMPVFAPTPGELMGMGYLARPIYFKPKRQGSRSERLHPDADYIYEQWENYSPGEKTFVFCGSIAESDAVADYFRQKGVPAISVTSKTPAKQVLEAFDCFADGRATVLVSCNKLAEGCDVPSATCVVLANHTESMSGAIQRIGRGARIAPGKTFFKVLDFVGIIEKFGVIENLEITAEDFLCEERKHGEIPEKQCEYCDACNFLRVRLCIKCGAPFAIDVISKIAPGDLERLTFNEGEERAIATFHALMLRHFREGSDSPGRQFFKQFGYYPPEHWVADACVPEPMRSPLVDATWKSFKKRVKATLPKDHIQLALPGF